MRTIVFVGLAVLIASCGGGTLSKDFIKIEGEAQGTTFHIAYKDSKERDFSNSIDSILKVMDMSLSMYVDSSLINKLNKSKEPFVIDQHILRNFWKSKEVFYLSDSLFDPTVMPLVNFWGFGTDKITSWESIDSSQVKELLTTVGLEKMELKDEDTGDIIEYLSARKFPDHKFSIVKKDPKVKLVFNAIAQGYSVDVICEFLESKKVMDYMVEIGGEVRVSGKNKDGEFWKIGIDKPKDESELGREIQAVVKLDNKSVATSGNYRKYYEKDGIKYSHTLNPKTGFPVNHTLLSATVLADDCTSADAWATAFMVMGFEKAREFVENQEGFEVYFIYSDQSGKFQTWSTQGVKLIIEEK